MALRGPFLGASYLFLKKNAWQRPLVYFAQAYRTKFRSKLKTSGVLVYTAIIVYSRRIIYFFFKYQFLYKRKTVF